ncbi:MAG: hypothetical protein CM15mP23_15100 [Cryomorphaceae bacterium]|nr:MAG: hypothetical protein CM15mP23_15100 [Cryomorphaceae bacterium]
MLLSNDTGLMHIGAAFKKSIVSFWGCTKPSLGFAPYAAASDSVEILSNISKDLVQSMGNPASTKTLAASNLLIQKTSKSSTKTTLEAKQTYQTLLAY